MYLRRARRHCVAKRCLRDVLPAEFAERDLWNQPAFGSVRLDTCVLHHLGPLFGIFGDKLAEVAGRTWKYPRAQLGVGQSLAGPAAKPSQRAAAARAADLAPIVAELQAAGARSLRAIAAGLNARGIRTPRGVGEWKAETVSQLLARLPI